MSTAVRGMICNFTLDCPDPGALASFYGELLGLQLDRPVENDWAVLCKQTDATPMLAFCGVRNYQPPRWPDPGRTYPQQAHLDLIVADFEAAERLVRKLGGTLLDRRELITVFADPVGHPFCMSADHWQVFSEGTDLNLASADGTAMVCNYTLECGDPTALAAFYAELLGLHRVNPDDDWVDLATDQRTHPHLAIVGVQKYRPPAWPDVERDYPQQAHLDLIVDDRAAAERLLLRLGGTRLADRGGAIPSAQRVNKDTYPSYIYADPAGHPFCLIEDRSPWWRTSLGNYSGTAGVIEEEK